jgi:L-2,4-diaminobutyrate decarboxylase
MSDDSPRGPTSGSHFATDPYDADAFRRAGHALIDRLADHLTCASRGEGPVVRWRTPEENRAIWTADFEHPESVLAVAERLIDGSIHNHHPGCLGYQVCCPLPVAALADLVVGVLSNGMASYDSGPAASAMEDAVVRWMTRALGMGDGADGVLTSGGSLGNLTALLAARQARAGFDAWSQGTAGARLCVLAGEHAHYSLSRAAGILGWGDQGVVPVALDHRFRLDVAALANAHRSVEREGRRVIAVVANGGSTATGAMDPLAAIADYCAETGLWMHVDAAHGASAVLSSAHKHRLEGISRADSVVWDAHKLMALPALVTGVLFRDGARSYEAFSQAASYLYEDGTPRPPRPWYDRGTRTIECTKRMMSAPLFTVLRSVGPRRLGEMVGASFDTARVLAERLEAEPDFEVSTPDPDCNIVCFRFVGPCDPEDLDRLQDGIRSHLLREGRWFLSRTRLGERVHLRAVVMNPALDGEHMGALIAAVRAAGRAVAASEHAE